MRTQVECSGGTYSRKNATFGYPGEVRGDQLARQWQLIQRLARSRAGCHLGELAQELSCVRRTLYRDLDALMYAGFPVVSERRNGRVYYRFLETFRLGDVPFTPDEILARALRPG